MPDDSTHLHLPYIDANQAQKHVTHNEAVRLIDALVQLSVKSRTLTTPPGSPADGDRFIVAPGATGAWASWDLNIAYWVDGAWMKLVPQQGWLAWIEAEAVHLRWGGSAWSGLTVASADISDSTVAGRAMLAAADAAAQTALLNTVSGAAKGLAPGGGTSAQVLRGDGTWGTVGANGIASNAVTNAKLADMAQGSIKGRVTAGSGDPEDLTADQAKGILGILTRIAGASGAAGADLTWQALGADAAAITATAPATVMTTAGVGAGTWAFQYIIRYQSAAAATGIGLAVNHSGTVSSFVSQSRMVTTGGAAATGIGDQTAAANAGQLVEGKAERAINTMSSAMAGVDTANADMLVVLEGIIVVTASGDLELKVASEVAGSGITVKAGTLLDLRRIA